MATEAPAIVCGGDSLPGNVRTSSAAILNRQLASAIDLHAQVKQAHWNVRGAAFIAHHELFDTIAAEVEDWTDMLAERAGALGAAAEGTIQRAASDSTLAHYPHGLAPGAAHLRALGAAMGQFSGETRLTIDEVAELGDAVTADVLTGICRAADQASWKLEAHFAPPEG